MRCAACVLKHAAKLPASHDVLRKLAALIEELLSRTDWQFIYTADRQQVRLVISGDRPFGLLIELIFRTEIEGGETSVRVGHGLGKSIGDQEAQASRKAFLRLYLESVIEGRAVGVEVVTNSSAGFAGIELRIWQQCLRQILAAPIVAKKIDVGSEEGSGQTRIVGVGPTSNRRLGKSRGLEVGL